MQQRLFGAADPKGARLSFSCSCRRHARQIAQVRDVLSHGEYPQKSYGPWNRRGCPSAGRGTFEPVRPFPRSRSQPQPSFGRSSRSVFTPRVLSTGSRSKSRADIEKSTRSCAERRAGGGIGHSSSTVRPCPSAIRSVSSTRSNGDVSMLRSSRVPPLPPSPSNTGSGR
jgi:hypothetical protein